MLNDIKEPPPPPEPEPERGPIRSEARPHNPAVRSHEHVQPHIDRKEPGLHHARIMGERTPTDAIYAMPMEDRGSTFSVGLSIAVIVIMSTVLIIVWLSLR